MNSKSYLDAQSVVSIANWDGVETANQFLSYKSVTVGKNGAKSGSAKLAIVPDEMVGEHRALVLKHAVIAISPNDMDTDFEVVFTDTAGKVEYLGVSGSGSQLSAQGTFTANMEVGELGVGIMLEIKFKRANSGDAQLAPAVKVFADGYVVVPV